MIRIQDSAMSKMEKILDRLNSIDTTLASQHEILKEHIRRTEILEREIEPIKKHVNYVTGVLKFIALSGIVATIIEALHMVIK